MQVKRLRILALEIFHTLNSTNPEYMKEIFSKNISSVRNSNNLIVNFQKTATYGENSLRALRPKIWNTLPCEVKNEISLTKFKSYIDTWSGPICKCSFYKSTS